MKYLSVWQNILDLTSYDSDMLSSMPHRVNLEKRDNNSEMLSMRLPMDGSLFDLSLRLQLTSSGGQMSTRNSRQNDNFMQVHQLHILLDTEYSTISLRYSIHLNEKLRIHFKNLQSSSHLDRQKCNLNSGEIHTSIRYPLVRIVQKVQNEKTMHRIPCSLL